MENRPPEGPAHTPRRPSAAELPAPEVADFIRFAYRRRRVGWPEIYDDMCAVAARREFRGWDHARLAELGVTFSLLETPRLAAWVRAVLPGMPRTAEPADGADAGRTAGSGADHRQVRQAAGTRRANPL